MISMFRTTALAAALAAASFGAAADSVILDFNALGKKPSTAGAPVAITGELQGLVFSNAYAYDTSMWDPNQDLKTPDCSPLQTPSCTASGAFIMNDDRVTDPGGGFSGISITRGANMKRRGEFFNSINLSVFDSGAALIYSVFKANATDSEADFPPSGSTSQDGYVWNPRSSSWDDSLQIDRIFITTGDSAFFGIRSLTIGLTAATKPDPSPVPEPAGYALVGLALLAAGAASRRRA